MTSRRVVCSMLVALALVASACGPGEGENASSDGEATLASFFGVGDEGDPAAMEASWRDQEVQIQEAIRACMAAEGFDYIPVQQPEGSYVVMGPEDELEQRETMGFGITTWFDQGDDDAMFDPADDTWEDPNYEIVEAMSETEREAYYEALWGDMEDMGELVIDEETGEEWYESTGFGGGCEGSAHDEAYGTQEDQQELWEQLEPAFEELYERIEADERIIGAHAEYGKCMSQAGYEIDSPDELWSIVTEDIQTRMDEIVGGDLYDDPFDGMTDEQIDAFFEESTEAEIDAFFADAHQSTLESIDREALDALKQEEIELAVADYHCSQDIHELYEEVSADYEAEFVANNRGLLEQIRDSQG